MYCQSQFTDDGGWIDMPGMHFWMPYEYSFGGSDSDFPHPEADFTGFVAATTQMNQKCSDVWDPISLKMKSWVNVPQLKRANGKGGKCAIM